MKAYLRLLMEFKVLDNVVNKEDKIAFIGNEIAITTLFKIINGEMEPDAGEFKWVSL